MPPLGNPSAISYSRSSARSDLKTFTFPLAPYNFRMRAICDESDMRTLLRLMLMAHSRATPGFVSVVSWPFRPMGPVGPAVSAIVPTGTTVTEGRKSVGARTRAPVLSQRLDPRATGGQRRQGPPIYRPPAPFWPFLDEFGHCAHGRNCQIDAH